METEIRKRIESGSFAANNGRIVRTVNVLKGKWVSLHVVKEALTEISGSDFDESLIYLDRADYIEIRSIHTRRITRAEDAVLEESEITLSHKGIKLANYYIQDEAVRV